MRTTAHWRAVKTSLARESEKWISATNADRVLWMQIMMLSDTHGIMEADPDIIWSTLTKHLHWSRSDTQKSIENLTHIGLVHTYWDGRRELLHVVDFDAHQPGEFTRRRRASIYQLPPCAGKFPEQCRHGTDKLPSPERELERELISTNVDILSAAAPPDDLSNETDDQENGDSDATTVFDHWHRVAAPIQFKEPGSIRLTSGRRELIQRRLKSHSVEELCLAIDGFAGDPFHRGDNRDKKPWLELKTIFKSVEKVETGIDYTRNVRAGRISRVRA